MPRPLITPMNMPCRMSNMIKMFIKNQTESMITSTSGFWLKEPKIGPLNRFKEPKIMKTQASDMKAEYFASLLAFLTLFAPIAFAVRIAQATEAPTGNMKVRRVMFLRIVCAASASIERYEAMKVKASAPHQGRHAKGVDFNENQNWVFKSYLASLHKLFL